MTKNKKESLIQFVKFKANPTDKIKLVLDVDGTEEIIINSKPFEKIKYIKQSYNDNLELNTNPKIKILSYDIITKDEDINEQDIRELQKQIIDLTQEKVALQLAVLEFSKNEIHTSSADTSTITSEIFDYIEGHMLTRDLIENGGVTLNVVFHG